MEWRKSESTARPDTIEETKSTVFLRRNIKETVRMDEESGDETTWYEYEEAKVSHTEYEEYMQVAEAVNMRQIRADVDYIALCAGVDLEV